MTNYEKIKAMSVEEMAKFLFEHKADRPNCGFIDCLSLDNCKECYELWLEEEAEE